MVFEMVASQIHDPEKLTDGFARSGGEVFTVGARLRSVAALEGPAKSIGASEANGISNRVDCLIGYGQPLSRLGQAQALDEICRAGSENRFEAAREMTTAEIRTFGEDFCRQIRA